MSGLRYSSLEAVNQQTQQISGGDADIDDAERCSGFIVALQLLMVDNVDRSLSNEDHETLISVTVVAVLRVLEKLVLV